MGHFAKHWPAELVEDVEDVIRKRVSNLIFCSSLYLTDSTIRYNLPVCRALQREEQPRTTTRRSCPQGCCIAPKTWPPIHRRLGRIIRRLGLHTSHQYSQHVHGGVEALSQYQ